MASPEFESFDELRLGDILREVFGSDVSIRGISRLTGVPYSTLQAIISGATTTPSQLTLGRLQRFYEAQPITRTMRLKTVADDALMWTQNKLENLAPPRSATAFQIIGRTAKNPADTARTGYIDVESFSPAEAVAELGIDPRTISRIVWARRGGFVRGF